jgi:hypothetical protein
MLERVRDDPLESNDIDQALADMLAPADGSRRGCWGRRPRSGLPNVYRHDLDHSHDRSFARSPHP